MESASVTATPQVPAGWYRDPNLVDTQRYWDGGAWTLHTAPVHPVGAVDNGPVATRGDWIAGVLISILMPLIGCIAGIYYVAKGGERAKCGWMCVGISIVAGLAWVAITAASGPEPYTTYR